MAITPRLGFGGKLEMSPDDIVAYVDVGHVNNLNPTINVASEETTHLQTTSPYEESIPGKVYVDVACDLNWDPAAANHKAAVLNIIGTLVYFKVTWPNGEVWKLQGYYTSVGPTMPAQNLMKCSVTIRVSGVPDYAA